ncbi:helix-turn-helix domain-containing protein [Streptomyces murinus]|uniref:helix-turn-helix domain-containing protein n=1 Tax=Streptomyces murinus TaxID=33900 RepID=UPI003825D7A1
MDNATWVQDLAAALAAVKTELAQLGHDLDVIKLSDITYETGIPEGVIRKLFAGKRVAAEMIDLPFKERLDFVVRTRVKGDGTPYTMTEIAASVGASKATISSLLSGTRNPGFEVSKKLTEFFRVDPGFFSVRGDKALLRALEPAMRQARLLASLKGQNVELLALRGSLAGGSPQLAEELQEVLEQVVAKAQAASKLASEDDPELRELTDTVRALPDRKRRRVMTTLRTFVGME